MSVEIYKGQLVRKIYGFAEFLRLRVTNKRAGEIYQRIKRDVKKIRASRIAYTIALSTRSYILIMSKRLISLET